jgi:lysozyme family protein
VESSAAAHDKYTPEFLIAVDRVLLNEGGYSSNPSDPGGATNFGISARQHPGLDIAALTRDAAIKIYWREWWLKFGFARLPTAAAAKTFDLAVNIGSAHAIVCLQRALRACGQRVSEDGSLGAETALAAARVNSASLICALRSEAASYYRVTAALARGPRANADREFLSGWLNRAYE